MTGLTPAGVLFWNAVAVLKRRNRVLARKDIALHVLSCRFCCEHGCTAERRETVLPPNELKNKEFSRVVRGYSIPEVDEYIAFLMEKYGELYQSCERIEQEKRAAMDALAAQKKQIQAVKNTLVAAQHTAQELLQDAQTQKKQIMDQTRVECEKLIASFETRIAEQKECLAVLKRATQELKNEMFVRYSDHIRMLEQLTQDLPREVEEIETATVQQYTDYIRHHITDEIEREYVSKTYQDIPPVLTKKNQTAAVFSDPDNRKITAPLEEDPTPTAEIPSLPPQADTKVGGAKIKGINRSVRSLNAQFDDQTRQDTSIDKSEPPLSQEEEFLRFLEEHPLTENEEESKPTKDLYDAVYGQENDTSK